MENETAYNELFDVITELNSTEKYDITIGIRDSNWVKPRYHSVPGYKCEIILTDGNVEFFSADYESADADEVQYSLNLLLEESLDAIVEYIKTKKDL